MTFDPRDEHAHPVDPRAFQTWKENWCLCGLDPAAGFSSVFHVSMRPVHGEAIFSAKLQLGERRFKHVRRLPMGQDPQALHPITDGVMTLEIVAPGEHLRIALRTEEVELDLDYRGRFEVFDFADGPLAPGESVLGDIGRHVFPFHHVEQGLDVTGEVRVAGEAPVRIAGRGNRDHSWGFRDDFGFRRHHWIVANFDDRFVGGSAMLESSYPDQKSGGAVASAAGLDPIVAIDTSDAYWLDDDEPLGALDRDVRYVLRTAGGEELAVVAHVATAHAALHLDARSPDRSQVYQDRQLFCDWTLETTGAAGYGVLELGKHLSGEGIADRVGRRPATA